MYIKVIEPWEWIGNVPMGRITVDNEYTQLGMEFMGFGQLPSRGI